MYISAFTSYARAFAGDAPHHPRASAPLGRADGQAGRTAVSSGGSPQKIVEATASERPDDQADPLSAALEN